MQLGKGGASPQHQHNALHFHGTSGGDKGHFIPLPDAWQGAKSTDFSEEAETSCFLSDEVPQTLQFKVKSYFKNSSSPASDPLPEPPHQTFSLQRE